MHEWLAQFQPAFNGVNTLLVAVSAILKLSRSQMGTLNWKETAPLKEDNYIPYKILK
jgi:hypothetical protein